MDQVSKTEETKKFDLDQMERMFYQQIREFRMGVKGLSGNQAKRVLCYVVEHPFEDLTTLQAGDETYLGELGKHLKDLMFMISMVHSGEPVPISPPSTPFPICCVDRNLERIMN